MLYYVYYRSDVKELYMGAFFDWACKLHSNIQEEDTIHYGVLAAVAAVLKHGKRDDLLPYASKLLEWVTNQNYQYHKAMLVRKYGVKIVQRIGKIMFIYLFMKATLVSLIYAENSRVATSTYEKSTHVVCCHIVCITRSNYNLVKC